MFVFVLSRTTLCHSSFAIILKRKRKLVALLLLSYRCIVTVMLCCSSSRCRGLVCSVLVIVVIPDHTHLLFAGKCNKSFYITDKRVYWYSYLIISIVSLSVRPLPVSENAHNS